MTSISLKINHTYDTANRLTSVNGQAVQWDENGNMLADGQAVYTYNTANRLVGVTKGTSSIVYAYSGLGDRLKQIADGVTTDYTLDINTGLTQVLQDNTNKYVYGNTRISQIAETQTGYFLPDALGSMRQMTDPSADLTLARAYDPYGNVVSSSGAGETVYGFDGDQQSDDGLIYLRARYYTNGLFISRDYISGKNLEPISLNKWLFGNNNPINNVDHDGKTAEKLYKQKPVAYDNNKITPPTGISFTPSNDPFSNGALGLQKGLYQAQFIAGWGRTYDKNTGLCGQVSITAILNWFGIPRTAVGVIQDYQDAATSGNINSRKNGPGDYINYRTGAELRDFVNYAYNRIDYPISVSATFSTWFKDINDSMQVKDVYLWDQWNAQWNGDRQYGRHMKNLIQGWLDSNEFAIAGVVADGTTGNLITDMESSNDTEHWVVISGISSEFSETNITDTNNWIRIYNPFNNQTEYYTGNEFLSSWNNRHNDLLGQYILLSSRVNQVKTLSSSCGGD
jgi:RHS repeat-associated protein